MDAVLKWLREHPAFELRVGWIQEHGVWTAGVSLPREWCTCFGDGKTYEEAIQRLVAELEKDPPE